jgi:choline dehydrogenase
VTAPYYEHPLNDLLLNATTELSDEYPLLKDLNDGRPIGLGEPLPVWMNHLFRLDDFAVGWGQATIARGFRSSSASSFARDSSDNVHILLNSLVARVQPVEGGLDDFRQVELVTDPDSECLRNG